ncbi:MAG: ABC transporter ATP-binding protein [Candidatus Promineifilaceae bacterium]|nr:ABC transporter ATP-binding protein [Candidatus Promineifilaceae bacterium]
MAIELRNITKKYGDIVALNDVSLNIENGEFVTLLGPSGCGKTTLLRIVAGFLQPDHGDVLLDGELVNHIPPNQRPTGMVFQSYALFPHMTVEKNISFGLRMRGAPKSVIDKKVIEVANLVGIEQMLNRYPNQLSGGQQQRVAVARTLAVEPSALLLDEPLAALDRKLRIGMRTELRKLVLQVGITTIFVTHDQEEALTMSDRIAVMDQGEIVQFTTPKEVYDNPKTLFVASFIGNSNLFQGILERDEESLLVFAGEDIRLALPSDFKGLVGRPVNLLLRPEHLQLKPIEDKKPEERMGVPGTITFETLLGLSIEYEVKLDSGAQLKIDMRRSRDQTPLPEGSRVWVTPIDSASYFSIVS